MSNVHFSYMEWASDEPVLTGDLEILARLKHGGIIRTEDMLAWQELANKRGQTLYVVRPIIVIKPKAANETTNNPIV